MKAMKTGWVVALFATAMLGCQKSQDPGSSYSNVKAAATHKEDPNFKPVVTQVVLPPQPDNTQQTCTKVFDVTVTGDHGSHLLMFTENTEATYEINVRSYMGKSFNVATEDLSPDLSSDFQARRARFKLVKQSDNVATYSFTWKPGKIHNGSTLDIQPLALRYTSDFAKICGKDIRETLNLLTVAQTPSAGAPKGAGK